MSGGLMQLVAYGAQDIYLTGNPQITFFKVVYRRHTNFSMECIQQTISGSSTVGANTTNGTVTISRNGDLLGSVYVRCDQGTDSVDGSELVSEVRLEVGGQEIDKQTKEWMQLWTELNTEESKASGYKYMTGGFKNALAPATAAGGTGQQSIQVPLQFWFCRNPGCYLPLIALQYHEVKLKFTWGGEDNVGRSAAATPTCEVWADYVYLDTDERRRFAQVSHEYLIEQVQTQTEGASNQKFKLNFNHPVKALYWTDNTNDGGVTTEKAKLTLNGHDRFAEQAKEFFQVRQPYQHHTAVPGTNVKETERPMLIQPFAMGGDGANGAATLQTQLDYTNGGGADGQVDIDAGVVTHTLGAASNGNSVKVGDIVSIFQINDTPAAASTLVATAQVTAVTNAKTSYTLSDTSIAIGANGKVQIHVIARVQDPVSRCSSLENNVNVYSFALKPEEHQPSGTCNFSRIDTAHLQYSGAVTVQNVYALNYNVLRVMSGMGGLAYSN